MIIRLNHAPDEPDAAGCKRASICVPVDALQRPLESAQHQSAKPAWLGSIAPAQRYHQGAVSEPEAPARLISRQGAPEASSNSKVPYLAPYEPQPLTEQERHQVVTETLSQPYQVQFAQRQPGLRPIVLPEQDDPWSQPVTAVAAARTGTIDDALSALLQAPLTALDAVKDKAATLAQGAVQSAAVVAQGAVQSAAVVAQGAVQSAAVVAQGAVQGAAAVAQGAAAVAQEAVSMAQGAATIVGASVSTKVPAAEALETVPAAAPEAAEVALEPVPLEQRVKAKSLGLGQGSHAIVDVAAASTKPWGLLRGLIRRHLGEQAAPSAVARQALFDASSALSGMMSMEQLVPLYEEQTPHLGAYLPPSNDLATQPMDDDLTYDQWIKQQGLPFAPLTSSNLAPGGCVSVSAAPVLPAVRWKNELNSKSLEPWGTVPTARLAQRLNSYFLHADHFSESFKRADRQHQMAAILGYGIFRQWLQRRRNALHERRGMVAPSQESLFYYTALLLIETMIFAMRVDGRIEQDEHDSLLDFCRALFDDKLHEIRGELDRMLTIDLDPERLAQQVQFPEESIDMYLLSAVILSGNCMLERNYLEALAACLGIDPTLRRSLDRRAFELLRGQDERSLNDSSNEPSSAERSAETAVAEPALALTER